MSDASLLYWGALVGALVTLAVVWAAARLKEWGAAVVAGVAVLVFCGVAAFLFLGGELWR
jgi:integral membrane sensor domain MASE1